MRVKSLSSEDNDPFEDTVLNLLLLDIKGRGEWSFKWHVFNIVFKAPRWKEYWKQNMTLCRTWISTWLVLGYPGYSLSFCVCVCVSVYVCLSTLLLPTMLVFHVTHSIPSKTAAGQGYTGTKEKQKFSCCKKKKKKKSELWLPFILWYKCIQLLSKCFHQQSAVVRHSHNFPFVFTNPSSFSTWKTPTHALQVLAMT